MLKLKKENKKMKRIEYRMWLQIFVAFVFVSLPGLTIVAVSLADEGNQPQKAQTTGVSNQPPGVPVDTSQPSNKQSFDGAQHGAPSLVPPGPLVPPEVKPPVQQQKPQQVEVKKPPFPAFPTLEKSKMKPLEIAVRYKTIESNQPRPPVVFAAWDKEAAKGDEELIMVGIPHSNEVDGGNGFSWTAWDRLGQGKLPITLVTVYVEADIDRATYTVKTFVNDKQGKPTLLNDVIAFTGTRSRGSIYLETSHQTLDNGKQVDKKKIYNPKTKKWEIVAK